MYLWSAYAWNLLGFSSTMFIIMNISEQCPVYEKRKATIVSIINGIFDASAGVFLIFKLVYDFTG